MDVKEAILLRRSSRSFNSRHVEWDKVGMILNAARFAPSPGNIQNWNFVVVRDDKKRESIAEACAEQFWMTQARVHIVVCIDEELAEDHYDEKGIAYSMQAVGGVVENMLLEATALGLSSCWVGDFDRQKLSDILGVPPHISPQAVVVIGYSDSAPDAVDKYKLYDLVFLEGWGKRIEDVGMVIKEWTSSKGALNFERDVKEVKRAVASHKEELSEAVKVKTGDIYHRAGSRLKRGIKELGKKLKKK